jgi:hypothetical protein
VKYAIDAIQPHPARDLHDASSLEIPRDRRRPVRNQIRLARGLWIDVNELSCRLQQERRRIAAKTRGERHLGAHEVGMSLLASVERSGLRRCEEPERCLETAGLEARPGRR